MPKRKAFPSIEMEAENMANLHRPTRLHTDHDLPPVSPQTESPSTLPVPGAWPRTTSNMVRRPSAVPGSNSAFAVTIKRWATTLRNIGEIALLPARHVRNYFFSQQIRVETIFREDGVVKKRLIDASFAKSHDTQSPSQRVRAAKAQRCERGHTPGHIASSALSLSSTPQQRTSSNPFNLFTRNAWSTFAIDTPCHTYNSPSLSDSSNIRTPDVITHPVTRDYRHKTGAIDVDGISQEQATKDSTPPNSLIHDDETFEQASSYQSSKLYKPVHTLKRKLRRDRGKISMSSTLPLSVKAKSPKYESSPQSPKLVDFKSSSSARVSKPATSGQTKYTTEHLLNAILSASTLPAQVTRTDSQNPQENPAHFKNANSNPSFSSSARASEPATTEHASHPPEHANSSSEHTTYSPEYLNNSSENAHCTSEPVSDAILPTLASSAQTTHSLEQSLSQSTSAHIACIPRDGSSISPNSHLRIIESASINDLRKRTVMNAVQVAIEAARAAAQAEAEAARLQPQPPFAETVSEELSFLSDAPDVKEDVGGNDSVSAGRQTAQVHWASHSSVRQFHSDETVNYLLDVPSQRTASSPPPHSRRARDIDEQPSVQEQPQVLKQVVDNPFHVALESVGFTEVFPEAQETLGDSVEVSDSDDSDAALAAAMEAALSEEVESLQEDVQSEPEVASTSSPPKVVFPLVTPLDAAEKGRLDEAAKAVGYGARSDANVVPRITAKDFGTLLPALFMGNSSAWLNDEIVNGYLDLVVKAILKEEGQEQKPRGSAPRVHAFSSFWMKSFAARPEGVRRWAAKAYLDGAKYLDADLVLYPICESNHWRLLAVKPKERIIEYLDSLACNGRSYISSVLKSIQTELGDAFESKEWTIIQSQRSSRQLNGSDCGVFVLLNALALLRGEGVERVMACNGMQDARERIALTLITGKPTLELA